MNNGQYQKYYLGGAALAVVFAGFLAVKLGVNLHDVLKDFSSTRQPAVTAPKNTAPQASLPKADAHSAAWRTAVAAQAAQKQDGVKRVYESFAYAPLWADAGRLRQLSQVAAFATAQAIDITAMSHLLQTANDRAATMDRNAATDVALARQTLRLADALRLGVVPTAALGPGWILPRDSFDAASGLMAALKAGAVKTYLTSLAGAITPGSGLGLAIAKQIAERLKIRISLEDPPTGVGLRVCLWFPTAVTV